MGGPLTAPLPTPLLEIPPPRGILLVGGSWHGHLKIVRGDFPKPGAVLKLPKLGNRAGSSPWTAESLLTGTDKPEVEVYRYHRHQLVKGSLMEALYLDGQVTSAMLLDALALSWNRIRAARGELVREGTR